MTEPRFVQHDGVRILVVDFTGGRGPELRRRVDQSARAIRGEAEPLLILTRVDGIELTPETTKLLLDYIAGNEPHTLASAVVGLGHLEKSIAIANRLTGRRLVAFDDEPSALSWLASHVHPLPEPDEAVHWIEHDGERILVLDFGNCNAQELLRRVQKAAMLIRSEPPRSVAVLNFLENFAYGRETNAQMIEYVKGNSPFIIAAAAVGLGYMKPAIPVLNRFTGRNIKAFDDAESARDWLASEKRRITRG